MAPSKVKAASACPPTGGAASIWHVASDDTYLQRYGFSDENVLPNRLFAERFWERDFLTIDAYGFQGLREEDDQGLIPIALPQVRARLMSEPWRWGSRFSIDTDAVALTRTDGLDTRRLSATGGWELPWYSPIGDRYELRLGVRGDLYQTDGDPQTFEENGTKVTARVIPRATLHWGWPFIGEVFGASQVIEPVAMATLASTGQTARRHPQRGQSGLRVRRHEPARTQPFPGLDRVQGGASVAYGLRFGTYTRPPLISGMLGQAYTFDEDVEFDPATGLDAKLSDYVGRIDFTPAEWLDVRYRFRLDKNDLTYVRNEVEVVTGPPRVRFDVGYLMLQDDPALQSLREREEIRGGLSHRPVGFAVTRPLPATTWRPIDHIS